MTEQIRSFYDPLAEHYHLIFDDWDKAIDHQGRILDRLIAARTPAGALRVLDCACGIGTQSIALAKLGHRVSGADLSPVAVARARSEALKRSLQIDFRVSDMTSMQEITERDFDVVIALDNALPHLSLDHLTRAAATIKSVLKPGGLFVASIRDYDQILLEKPTIQQPAFYSTHCDRCIVHQVWDWVDEVKYVLHLYITRQTGSGWDSLHFVSEYHCIRREQLSAFLYDVGFEHVEWLMASDSGFYQPIVIAKLPGERSE
jgi:glycine/sarcosine N-methyltransferase